MDCDPFSQPPAEVPEAGQMNGVKKMLKMRVFLNEPGGKP